MNKKTLYSLTHGMYILTTTGGACFVDAVCQVSGGDNPLVSVAVMKKNYTNTVMHNENMFSISIFGMNDDPALIENFGMHSQRDYQKFNNQDIDYILDCPVIMGTLGYMVLEKVDTIENDTHTIFIGKVVEANINKEDKPMSYNYYQEHKSDLIKVKTETGKTAWVCKICGYVYYGETLPEDFKCPICQQGKEMFEKK